MAKKAKAAKILNIDKLFKDMDKKRKKHPVYYFFHDVFWSTVRFCEDIPRNIKTFIQRGKRGYADSDTWSFFHYLSEITYKGIRHLKENNHGTPCNLTEGQWIDILSEITYGFCLAHEIGKDELYLIRDKKEREKWQKTLDDINEKYKKDDDHVYLRCMNHKEIIAYDKAWKLLKEYYFNLWD